MASEPYIGEIRAMAFNFNPKSWALCNGQLLAINQNQALFSILGTTYGGNGVTTFALPDLRGRVPIHFGNDGSGNIYNLGQQTGVESVTLTSNQISHTHTLAANASANGVVATGNFPAAPPAGSNLYGPGVNATMAPTIVGVNGGSQPHPNLQPLLVLNYCICLAGIFPSRN
jgi:microcystin-dependent protein